MSKAGYVNHKKSHVKYLGYANLLPSRPADTTCVTTCVICSKKCKTTAGLKWHMVIHKKTIPHSSSVNPLISLGFIYHVCHRPCKSAAGLKSHLRAHGRNLDSNNSRDDEVLRDSLRLSRRSNQHVCATVLADSDPPRIGPPGPNPLADMDRGVIT